METVTVEMRAAAADHLGRPRRPALDLSARLPAPPPPARPAPGRHGVPVVPWVITGALAAAAGTAGGLALWSSSDLKQRREQWVWTAGDLHRLSTRGQTAGPRDRRSHRRAPCGGGGVDLDFT